MLDGISGISWGVLPLSATAPAGPTARAAGRGRGACDGFDRTRGGQPVDASRAAAQVCHTSQGQDERAYPQPLHLPRGLDVAWRGGSNPHRESGMRWRAAADVGQAAEGSVCARSEQERFGNRLGDSVGAGRRGGDFRWPFFSLAPVR